MKYMIFLLLVSSFIACNQGSQSGSGNGDNTSKNADASEDGLTIWNHTAIHLRIKRDDQQILELKEGKCVTLSAEELQQLTVEEDDHTIFTYDDVICSNTDQDATPCTAGTKVVQEAEDGDGWVLADYSGDEVCGSQGAK